MQNAIVALILGALALASQAEARSAPYSVPRTSRSCHCERYSDPHYSRYVPRTAPYRGGRPTRY